MKNWASLIFSDETGFADKARQVFEYQYEHNPVYRRYCDALKPDVLEEVRNDTSAIPMLPVKAFKDARVSTQAGTNAELIFKSSGTTDMERSSHPVHESSIYDRSIREGFRHFYDMENCVIWGYTPGYADNPHSSLIYMIQKLIEQDESGLSRFLPLEEPLSEPAVARGNSLYYSVPLSDFWICLR